MRPRSNVIAICLCILFLSQLALLHPVMAGDIKISAAGDNCFVLKSVGTLWAWGRNQAGQLGDGTTVDKRSPVQIGADKDWVSIAKGTAHTIALKKNGTLWAWGSNTYGQLGDGTTVNKNAPVQIGDKW